MASRTSSLAKGTEGRVSEENGGDVENLHGDGLRLNLHHDIGFTQEDRAINNRRTTFAARLLNRHDLPTIVAIITLFRDSK